MIQVYVAVASIVVVYLLYRVDRTGAGSSPYTPCAEIIQSNRSREEKIASLRTLRAWEDSWFLLGLIAGTLFLLYGIVLVFSGVEYVSVAVPFLILGMVAGTYSSGMLTMGGIDARAILWVIRENPDRISSALYGEVFAPPRSALDLLEWLAHQEMSPRERGALLRHLPIRRLRQAASAGMTGFVCTVAAVVLWTVRVRMGTSEPMVWAVLVIGAFSLVAGSVSGLLFGLDLLCLRERLRETRESLGGADRPPEGVEGHG